MSVWPCASANCAARLDGAETDAIIDSRAGERLLQNLERRSPADQQHVIAQWPGPVQECEADRFIHRVVPADVFPKNEQAAARFKDGRGVQPAGALERLLSCAHRVRHFCQLAR